jgi:hypothetical protein
MIGIFKNFKSCTIKNKINYQYINKFALMKKSVCPFSTKIISDTSKLDEKTLNLANSIKITEKCAEVKF